MYKLARTKGYENDSAHTVNECVHITHTTTIHNSYVVMIDNEIGAPEHFRELLLLLLTATEGDSITLIINSPGGYIDSLMPIIDAISNAAVEVKCILNGECHSAASILALYCHSVEVRDTAYMLVHNFAYGDSNNMMRIKDKIDFYHARYTKFIYDAYEGFLTSEEVNEVINGKELWLDADNIRTRLNNRLEYFSIKNNMTVDNITD